MARPPAPMADPIDNKDHDRQAATGTVRWDEEGDPISVHYDDRYYSANDARGETREVFLRGNGLPERWKEAGAEFTIAELGFGTGLNVLETIRAWQGATPGPERLTFVSFELHPLNPDEIARALSGWTDLHALVGELLIGWPSTPGWHTLNVGNATLRLFIGNARSGLDSWTGSADAWYLDGFSPAKNPDLWSTELMCDVYTHTAPEGTFSTFTAAGWVRRNLETAGFTVTKVPGFPPKRERLQGIKEK